MIRFSNIVFYFFLFISAELLRSLKKILDNTSINKSLLTFIIITDNLDFDKLFTILFQ